MLRCKWRQLMRRCSRWRSGELSNSARGGGSSRPPLPSDSAQCNPERSMLRASARNTWCTWKFAHTASSAVTAYCQRKASEAMTAADTAPAEVPTTIGKGLGAWGRISAIAFSTPT